MEESESAKEVSEKETLPLPPLPFTYERTYDSAKADYSEHRKRRVARRDEPPTYSDEELLETIRRKEEAQEWYTKEEWRKKGVPQEQVEVLIDGKPVTIYNYNKENGLTDEHLKLMGNAFQEYFSRFPQAQGHIRWVLIDDFQKPSDIGDEERYPLNGSMVSHDTINLQPRTLNLTPHRITKTTNLEGTVAHELTHINAGIFKPEWATQYGWKQCWETEGVLWELRPNPAGKGYKYYSIQTGEVALDNQYPLKPEESITPYAKRNLEDDICDSVVAYIYDPQLLQDISPGKYSLIESHDAKNPKPEVRAVRIPKDQIKLPEIQPKTIYYYIEEPEVKD